MKTATLHFTKSESEKVLVSLFFDGLLKQEDYDLFWGESGDGSDGEYSETVEAIWEIYQDFVDDDFTDFQVWGEGGTSFGGNIPAKNVKELESSLKAEFGNIDIYYSGDDELINEITKPQMEFKSYQQNENDVVSYYVLSDDEFTEEDAWDFVAEHVDLESIEFVAFDDAVANHNNYNNCAIFHEVK